MDADALRTIRAECVMRLEFPPLGQTPEQDTARKKRNETRLRLAELADMYIKSEREHEQTQIHRQP